MLRLSAAARREIHKISARQGMWGRIRQADLRGVQRIDDDVIGHAFAQANTVRPAIFAVAHRIAGDKAVRAEGDRLCAAIHRRLAVETALVGVGRIDDRACANVGAGGFIHHGHNHRAAHCHGFGPGSGDGNIGDIFIRNRHRRHAIESLRDLIAIAIFITRVNLNGGLVAAGIHAGVVANIGQHIVIGNHIRVGNSQSAKAKRNRQRACNRDNAQIIQRLNGDAAVRRNR